MKPYFLKTLLIFLLPSCVFGQNPTAIDTGLYIEKVMAIQESAVRLVYDEINQSFLYSTIARLRIMALMPIIIEIQFRGI